MPSCHPSNHLAVAVEHQARQRFRFGVRQVFRCRQGQAIRPWQRRRFICHSRQRAAAHQAHHPIWGPPGASWPGGPGYPPSAQPPIYYPPVIGGGPIVPPGQPPVPGSPTFPIWGPPGISLPPIAGYPPIAGWPIVPPPDGGNGGGEGEKPPFEMRVAWSPTTGWIVVYVPTGEHPVPSKGAATPPAA